MFKNVRPGEALIVGAVVLVVVLAFLFDFGPWVDFVFYLFGWVPGFPLGNIVLGGALVGGALLGVRLARKDAAAKTR